MRVCQTSMLLVNLYRRWNFLFLLVQSAGLERSRLRLQHGVARAHAQEQAVIGRLRRHVSLPRRSGRSRSDDLDRTGPKVP